MIKNFKNLFFKNIGIKQTIFKNIFWLILSEGVYRFSGIILIIYIIRILGATEYGKFAFAISFVSMFVILSDFGLSDITIREFSRNKENEKKYSAILSLKILLSIGTLIIMLIGSFFITFDPVIRKVIWILAVFILINNFFSIIYAFFRARQQMEYETRIKVIQSLIMIGIVFFVLFKLPSIVNISYGYLFANLVALVLIIFFFHFFIHPLKLSLDKNIWKRFLKLSWPLGLAVVFSAIFLNIDSVIMGYQGQITQNGWYNAARKIVNITIIPATLIVASFYPILSKFFKESKEKLQTVWNYQMELMIVLALPLTTGGVVLAPKIINFFYGSSFNPSVFVFQILIFTVGLNFLSYPYSRILIVLNQQRKYLWIYLIAAVINIILNLILIPRYSLYGAAVSAVITYASVLFLGAGFLKYFTLISPFNLKLFKILIMAIFSSLIMFIIVKQLMIYNLNIIPIVILGTLVYFTTLILFYKFLLKSNFLLKNLWD